MAKVICVKNIIYFEDDDFIISDLVNVGEIYESEPIIYLDDGEKSYDLWNVYIHSNTTDDIWSCPIDFFMDLNEWRAQQIDKII
jgi:hypothetical protein